MTELNFVASSPLGAADVGGKGKTKVEGTIKVCEHQLFIQPPLPEIGSGLPYQYRGNSKVLPGLHSHLYQN